MKPPWRMPEWLTPNGEVSKRIAATIVGLELIMLLFYWYVGPSPLFPRPVEILGSLFRLNEVGLGHELVKSTWTFVKALAISTALSLTIAYLMVLPIGKPVAKVVSTLRFLGMSSLKMFFIIALGEGGAIKMGMLVFSISVFMVTSLVTTIENIPPSEWDDAGTLGLGRWRALYEVVIRGQLDRVLDIVRECAAIGWMMLTAVEGLARYQGGIGVMMIDQDKYTKPEELMATMLAILLVGFGIDALMRAAKRYACSWSPSVRGK